MKSALVAALPFFFLCAICSAGTIEVVFSGTISISSLPGVAVGDSFSGTMTYETTPGTVFDNTATLANYGFFQPQDGVVIIVDGYTFAGSSYLNMAIDDTPDTTIPDKSVDVLQGSSDGVFGTLSTNYPALTLGATVASFSVNPALVPGNAIPNPFNLSDVVFPGTTSDPDQVYAQLGSLSITGNINDITVAPEPSTFLLIGSALAFGWRFRRRTASTKSRSLL